MSNPLPANFPVNVSRETLDRLIAYQQLILKWNQHKNLIASSTEPHLWERHILDSLWLAQYLPSDAKTLLDMGAGGGFPGLVLASARPDLHCTLVDSNGKKTSFLEYAALQLGLKNTTILQSRMESLNLPAMDVVTARAFTSLSSLFSYAQPVLSEKSLCIFPKGDKVKDEVEEATRHYHFSYQQCSGYDKDANSVVLLVNNIKHK